MLKIIFLHLIAFQQLLAYKFCQTPNFKLGHCTPIRQCPSIFLISSSTNSTRIIEYIGRSHCRFDENGPQVCCPLSTSAQKPENSTSLVSTNLLPNPEVCGQNFENIYEERKFGEFPWLALLEYKYNDSSTIQLECSGFLINEKYVVTAAHCIGPELVGVRLGVWNNPKYVDQKYQSVPIEEKIIFKSYNSSDRSKPHDIALLRLENEAKFNDFVQPICLPVTFGELINNHFGEKLILATWGIGRKKPHNKKHRVEVPVTSLDYCVAASRNLNLKISLDSGHICAGGEEGKDSCSGDSGGPLMIVKKQDGGNWYAIGIVSFGSNRCGKKNRPAVYVRVSKYIYWIVDNLKP